MKAAGARRGFLRQRSSREEMSERVAVAGIQNKLSILHIWFTAARTTICEDRETFERPGRCESGDEARFEKSRAEC